MILNQNKYLLISFLFISLFSIFFEKEFLTNDIMLPEENEKLLFVWEHFRHGARDPYTKVNKKTDYPTENKPLPACKRFKKC